MYCKSYGFSAAPVAKGIASTLTRSFCPWFSKVEKYVTPSPFDQPFPRRRYIGFEFKTMTQQHLRSLVPVYRYTFTDREDPRCLGVTPIIFDTCNGTGILCTLSWDDFYRNEQQRLQNNSADRIARVCSCHVPVRKKTLNEFTPNVSFNKISKIRKRTIVIFRQNC